jgi:hypothetical protein
MGIQDSSLSFAFKRQAGLPWSTHGLWMVFYGTQHNSQETQVANCADSVRGRGGMLEVGDGPSPRGGPRRGELSSGGGGGWHAG